MNDASNVRRPPEKSYGTICNRHTAATAIAIRLGIADSAHAWSPPFQSRVLRILSIQA
jgi:hypothetical protein